MRERERHSGWARRLRHTQQRAQPFAQNGAQHNPTHLHFATVSNEARRANRESAHMFEVKSPRFELCLKSHFLTCYLRGKLVIVCRSAVDFSSLRIEVKFLYAN